MNMTRSERAEERRRETAQERIEGKLADEVCDLQKDLDRVVARRADVDLEEVGRQVERIKGRLAATPPSRTITDLQRQVDEVAEGLRR
jgi:hypothetical protein